jgi:predicted metal-dependent hydrolase
MNVKVNEFGIKKMKTKWGTCNIEAKRIWLNLELAKKPAECLEYVVVHEMVHLLERNHNDKFEAYMNQFLPKWSYLRDELNRLPVGYGEWQ